MAGFEMVLTIGADGSCTFDQERGRCSAKGGKLVWSGSEGSETYAYSLSGDTMTISGGDMEMAIAFQRKGGRAPAEAAGSPGALRPGHALQQGGLGRELRRPRRLEARREGRHRPTAATTARPACSSSATCRGPRASRSSPSTRRA
jgi:hypothetical protein